MASYDDMKLAVEALTGGRNTVLFDDIGMPSIMVVIPKQFASEIVEGGADVTHPAFVVGGTEVEQVYVSKYLNIIANERAYSLPFRDPSVNNTADEEIAACRKKGEGWAVTPLSVWAAVALWSKKHGTMPHGNNGGHTVLGRGRDYTNTNERGVRVPHADDNGRTFTGSGPAVWNHDHTPEGICDLNGIVWERIPDFQCRAGEICFVPNADAFLSSTDLSDTSTAFKAVLMDGSLVNPGTANTIKMQNNQFVTNITERHGGKYVGLFKDFAAGNGVTIPQVLKNLAIYPADDTRANYGEWAGGAWLNNSVGITTTALRGGDWHYGAGSGVFALTLINARSYRHWRCGFRSAAVRLL